MTAPSPKRRSGHLPRLEAAAGATALAPLGRHGAGAPCRPTGKDFPPPEPRRAETPEGAS